MLVPARVLACFLFVVLTVSSAAAGPISGRVVDPDGQPIDGATILISSTGQPLQSVTTADGGRFSVSVPSQGKVTIRVAAQGFRGNTVELDAADAARDVGTIALSVSAITESIVVSASQVEVPLTQVSSSVTVIGRAEIEARQLRSVADALRSVPGLAVVGTGGLGTTTSVFPRGGESNFTLVLMDGVPMNAFGGDFDFGQVSTANVERIEIVRGPQSAIHGANAIGAVVRIVTRRGGPPSAQFTAEGGELGTSRLAAATSGQRGAFEWGALYEQLLSDGMNGERTAAGAEIVNDDYERRTGAVSAGWRRGSAVVRADVRHSNDDRGFPGPYGSNPIGSYTGIDAVSRGENDRTVGAISAAAPISSRVRAHAYAGYSRLESNFASRFGGSESFSRRWIGRAQADVALAPGLDLSTGLELQRERAGSTFITGATFQRIPIERSTEGYFGEARFRARERLFVTGGIRVEHIRREQIENAPSTFSPRPVLPEDTVVSANPRLSVAWFAAGSASNYTRIRGAVGTGIRPPDGFELAFTDNPSLKPERSVSGEAGVDRAFANGHGLLEATAFVNEYDDLIVAVGSFSGSSRYRTDNISNARARGLEVALTMRGRTGTRRPIDVTGRISYTLLDTEVLAVDGNPAAPPPFSVGQALLRRPTHQFSADAGIAAGQFSAFLHGGGRSRELDVEPSLGTFGGLFDADGYQVWHAGAAYRIGRIAEVFGRVENLFDRAYEEAFGYPALGRRFTAGLRVAAGR